MLFTYSIDVYCVWQLAYKPSRHPVSKLISLNPLSGKSARSSLVPCFPLQAILIALNRTTVDYFSLDVEGFEFDVSFCVCISERFSQLF